MIMFLADVKQQRQQASFMKIPLFFASLTFVLLSMCACDVTAARPNVVFLLSDDQGWGDYGFMGHPHLKTPNLDALAGAGLR